MTEIPQAEWCGDRGPRIGNEGAMVCVLPAGHEGQHEGDPSWRQCGWPNDRPVFRHPDLPSPQPDTAPRMMQSIWQKEVGKDTVDLTALPDPTEHADPCIEETCSMCDEPATHKVAEDDSRNHGLFRTHPFTNYVCCEHFGQIMQVTCEKDKHP